MCAATNHNAPPLVYREVSGDVGGGTSSGASDSDDDDSGSESDDDDGSDSDSESWGKVCLCCVTICLVDFSLCSATTSSAFVDVQSTLKRSSLSEGVTLMNLTFASFLIDW